MYTITMLDGREFYYSYVFWTVTFFIDMYNGKSCGKNQYEESNM